MSLYTYFRNVLGDFDGSVYTDLMIDNLALNGDQFIVKMVGLTPTDSYLRALAAAYVYTRSRGYTDYEDNSGVIEIKVGDVTEKYGRSEIRRISNDIKDDLMDALRREYGEIIKGVNSDDGLERGVIINDLEE